MALKKQAGIQSFARENMALSAVSAVGEQLLVATRRSFSKGARQNDIYRFESYTPSQPVRSFLFDFRLCTSARAGDRSRAGQSLSTISAGTCEKPSVSDA
jgi:hypothetical protein